MGNLHFHSGYTWLYVTFLCLGIAITVRLYRRYTVSRFRRWSLIALRILILALLAGFAGEPALDTYQRTIRSHTLALLLDSSASMSIQEDGRTRWQRAREILAECDLPEAVQIQTYQWGEKLSRTTPEQLSAPEQTATRMGDALQGVLDLLQHQRPATILLISDGLHNKGPSPLDAARRARTMGIPIHTVLVGSDGPRDIQIVSVEADSFAFAETTCTATVRLRHRGFEGQVIWAALSVKEADGQWQEIRREPVELDVPDPVLTFRWTPRRPGLQHYQIHIAEQQGEAITANNRADLYLHVVERRLRILQLDGNPRWDSRFLRNALLRDPRMDLEWQLVDESSGLDDLRSYDLLILGDIPARFLKAHLDPILRFVEQGGGLLLRPGRQHTWQSLASTRFQQLVPVQLEAPPQLGQPTPYLPELTQVGRTHPASQSWSAILEGMELHTSLLFRWYYPTGGARVNAQVLAQHPSARIGDVPAPLIATQYYGEGRVLFAGIDESWRWRRLLGEADSYPLWSQAIQWLGMPHLLGGLGPIQLSVDPPQTTVGDPIRVTARLRRDLAGTIEPLSLEAFITPGGQRVALVPQGSDGRIYEGTFSLEQPGEYRIRIELNGESVEQPIQIKAARLEWQQLAADADRMRQIASISGGDLHSQDTPWDFALKPEIVERYQSLQLWDNLWILMGMLLLLSLEWALKRRWHLS